MTVPELVEKLKAGHHRADAIARIIGYIVMIQRMGWDKLPLNRTARFGLEKTLRLLEIDPLTIEI